MRRERARILKNLAARRHSFDMLAEALEWRLAATGHERSATRRIRLASALPYLSFSRLLRINGADLFVRLLFMQSP